MLVSIFIFSSCITNRDLEYIYSNGLDFFEGNVVKYITRHRTKGDGEKDIRKVIHYAQMILEMEYGKGE